MLTIDLHHIGRACSSARCHVAALIHRAAMGVLAMLASTAALAQERFPTATGASDRAAFQVQGLPAGGFRLYPTLRATVGYDDNVRLGTGRRGGDGIVTIAPAVAARSQWSTHALNAAAFLRDNRYFTRSTLNNDEYGATADGRLDVLRTLLINASGGYSHLIELRGTPGDLGAINQFIDYDVTTGAASITKRLNRFAVTAGANGANFRYDDVVSQAGRLDQSFRSRNVRTGTLRLDYQYGPATSLFVTGGGTRIRYRDIAADGIDRASSGYSLLGGVRFEISRLISGEVGVGYISQSFRDARFNGFSGINYNADIRYQPTALTSFRLSASRQLTDSALRQVGGVLASTVAISAEHELLRNLILGANASYSRYAYRGIDANNSRYDLGIGARYRLSNALSAALSVSHVGQSAGGTIGRRYEANRVSLSLLVAR